MLPRAQVQFKGGRSWVLMRPFFWKGIVVPRGFVTDLASIPSALWPLGLTPFGQYIEAAIVHDWHYRTGTGTRKAADQLMANMMKVYGVRWWKRKVIYRAVRLFGGRAWKNKPAQEGESS